MPSAPIAFREARHVVTDPFAHLREDWVQVNYDIANRLWEESDWFRPSRGPKHLRDYGIRRPCEMSDRVREVWERHKDDGPLVAPPHLTLRLPTMYETVVFYCWALAHRIYGEAAFDTEGNHPVAGYLRPIGGEHRVGWRWEYPMDVGCSRGMSPVHAHHPLESVGVELLSLLMLAPTTWGRAMNGREVPFVVFGNILQCSILNDPSDPTHFNEVLALRTTFNNHVVRMQDKPFARTLSHRWAHPRRILA